MRAQRAAAILAVALALAGCSSDSTGSTDTTGPAPTPAPATTDPATTDPATTEPTSTEPTSTEPTSTEPATTEPATTDPATTEPAVRPSPVLAPSTIQLEELVDLAVRPDDDGLYLVERVGRVTVVRGGAVDATVLDISDQTESGGEQGFLGLAFAADGAHAYVNVTDLDGNTVVSEFAVADDGTFDPASQREVLTVEQPYPNHNGGDLAVGPDGMLYIGMGDGGSADDPERRAQDPGELLGKILRIDPSHFGEQPYTIPADNPFVDTDGARGEIWAIGVRNPWRFSFDPETGDLWIADVGQGVWEEVDHLPADADGMNAGRGANLGWSAFEGLGPFNADQSAPGHTPPIHVYEHGDDGCSISGGAVYRGDAVAGLDGWFVFGDFCSGKVWALEVLPDGTAGELLDVGTVSSLTAIAPGPDGELYALSLDGTLQRISG